MTEREEIEYLTKLVYELETNCDPASNVRDIVSMRENIVGLNVLVMKLRYGVWLGVLAGFGLGVNGVLLTLLLIEYFGR